MKLLLKAVLYALIVVVMLMSITLVVMLLINPNPTRVSAPAKVVQVQIDRSPKAQDERNKTIHDAIRLGIFTKVERDGIAMPRAWVGHEWANLPFETKALAISVVYAYYLDGGNAQESVAIIDGFTGKEIGRFDTAGLRLK